MKRIRHSPERIIRKLREADAELAKGTAVPAGRLHRNLCTE